MIFLWYNPIAACMGLFKRAFARASIAASLILKERCFSVFAVIETGGKQYKVSEGDIIFVEKLEAAEGETVTIDKVLAVSAAEGFVVGAPYTNYKVTANVVKNGKGKKLHIIRYKSKKNEKKHIGHRQPYTKLQITSIAL